MCDPLTVAVIGTVGGLAMSALQPKPEMPKPPEPVQPPKTNTPTMTPQGAREQQGGMGPGNASTLLTGSGGVSPGSLLLGRNDLLGK